LFCEYDSGHDNGPRFAHGLPKECPDGDARRCPDFPGLPFLAPDLSATVYGGRIALGKMGQYYTFRSGQYQREYPPFPPPVDENSGCPPLQDEATTWLP